MATPAAATQVPATPAPVAAKKAPVAPPPASLVTATPAGLDSGVPRIVVTEPSPLIRSPSTVSLEDKTRTNVNSQPDETGVKATASSASPVASAASPVVSAQTAAVVEIQEEEDSSDEFNSVAECTSCIVPVADIVDESRIDIEDIDQESSSSDPPTDFRHIPGCCSQFGGFRGFYYSVAQASDSKWAVPFWFLMMALPIAAGFMGARYVDDCRYSPATPALMFMMGITGVIMLSVRCMLVLGESMWEDDGQNPCLQITLVITYVLTVILFCTELMTFWRFDPSFDIISPRYCDPTFYTFTYWLNWTVVVVFILMFIIRFPMCLMNGRHHS